MPDATRSVRAATDTDAAAVLELARGMAVTFTFDDQAFRSTYAELVRAPDAHLLVADVGGQVVGYLLGFTHPSFFANGPVAWVEELAVAAPVRRQAMGTALMGEFERRAAGSGCRLVALCTTRAHHFYGAIGYDAHATYFRKLL